MRLILLFLTISLSGCAAQAAPARYDVPLWQISDHDNTVYILGSLHALRPEDYPLPAVVYEALRESDRVVFEVDMSQVAAREARAVSEELGFFGPDRSLAKTLSPGTLALLERYLAARGESIAIYNRSKPWLVGLQIGLNEVFRLGYDPRLGVDTHLMEEALGLGKPIGQLETFREQMSLLASDPLEVQERSLRVSLENIEGFGTELRDMVQAWKQGDADALYRIGIAPSRDDPLLEAQLARIIDQRNVTMAARIREYIEGSEDVLVVVGALHLGGSPGILQLLSEDYAPEQAKKLIKQ